MVKWASDTVTHMPQSSQGLTALSLVPASMAPNIQKSQQKVMRKSHGKHYKTDDPMLTLFLWMIACVCLSIPAWLLYYYWNKTRTLNQRLAQCDDALLTDSSVKITQIVSAPAGTIVTENATLVVMPSNGD